MERKNNTQRDWCSLIDYVRNRRNFMKLIRPEIVKEHGWTYVYDDYYSEGVYSPEENIVVTYSDCIPHYFIYDPKCWRDIIETDDDDNDFDKVFECVPYKKIKPEEKKTKGNLRERCPKRQGVEKIQLESTTDNNLCHPCCVYHFDLFPYNLKNIRNMKI